MKRLTLFLIPVLLLACQQEDLTPRTESEDTPVYNPQESIQGKLMVKLEEGADPINAKISTRGTLASENAEIDELIERYGIVEIKKVYPEGGRFAERRRQAGLDRWYEVTFDQSKPATRAAMDFTAIPGIEIAETLAPEHALEDSKIITDYTYSMTQDIFRSREVRNLTEPFNDTYLYRQWHYYNDGERGSKATLGADINLFPAWMIEAGKREVIVVVVDSGIEYFHPDLAANIWVNEAELNGTPGEDSDGNGYVDDIYGWNTVLGTGEIIPMDHGTHVAGTIAAVNNNGIGVCGVAGGTGNDDGVRIMITQRSIPDPENPSESWSNSTGHIGMVYGADNGAVIANNSWGTDANRSYLREAIEYFIRYAGLDEHGNQEGPMAGGIVICSAGNQSREGYRYPGAYSATHECVVSVANIASDYVKASSSNYGDWVTLGAPGGTSKYSGDKYKVYSTAPGGKYAYKNGTSMASPHVAGIAALIVSKYGVDNPGLTNTMVKKMLVEACDLDVLNDNNPDYFNKLGAGLIDAYKALTYTAQDLERFRE